MIRTYLLAAVRCSCLPINSAIKIKVLYWDKTGFALWYKRLEKAKYKWPSKEKNQVFTLTQFELDRLLSGFTIIGHEPVKINDFTMS
ncbi:IS66 family insertion sequence element accessory protein TnpB [Vibrio anguillarum]|uniref:IS66 family insertion sequence element accessory protein TnpB n=1 Tax=Vibrio anguillarum TaxID=55601 RepID=UPI003D17F929